MEKGKIIGSRFHNTLVSVHPSRTKMYSTSLSPLPHLDLTTKQKDFDGDSLYDSFSSILLERSDFRYVPATAADCEKKLKVTVLLFP